MLRIFSAARSSSMPGEGSCRSTPTGSPATGDRSAASAIAATTIRQPSAALPAQFTSLPANDGELGPIVAFSLHPHTAFAGQSEITPAWQKWIDRAGRDASEQRAVVDYLTMALGSPGSPEPSDGTPDA